jgi:hypothetical protein
MDYDITVMDYDIMCNIIHRYNMMYDIIQLTMIS